MMNSVLKMMNSVLKMMKLAQFGPGAAHQTGPYLLQRICMHNFDPKSGANYGFCYLYIFPGVGMRATASPSPGVRNNAEYCIKNEKFCIKNEEFCI